MTDFDYERIADARKALAGRVIRTPVMPLCSSKIAPYIPDNAELFIKLELFQHTGSFKARGSCLGIDWLDDAQRQRGVAGFSGGNFALALASADVPAKVVMSKTADPYRIQGCRELGAEVVLVDGIAAALPMLETIEAEEGRRILHPFNDMNMAYGAATCGAEMVEDMPPLDMVVVPVGGGGLIAGMAAAIRKMSPDTLIIGVEPEGANSLSRSFASGEPETLDSINTIADSLGAPMALAESMSLARENVGELITIPDSLMADTMLLMRHTLNIVAEPACTASLGSVLGPLRERAAGKRVGVLACGSNIGSERFEAYTSGARMPMPPV
jgi:threonine dehydratase